MLHHLLCLSSLPRPASNSVANYWKKLTFGVTRSFTWALGVEWRFSCNGPDDPGTADSRLCISEGEERFCAPDPDGDGSVTGGPVERCWINDWKMLRHVLFRALTPWNQGLNLPTMYVHTSYTGKSSAQEMWQTRMLGSFASGIPLQGHPTQISWIGQKREGTSSVSNTSEIFKIKHASICVRKNHPNGASYSGLFWPLAYAFAFCLVRAWRGEQRLCLQGVWGSEVLEVCNAGALLALDLLDFEASEFWTHLNSRFLYVLASPEFLLTGVRVAPLPYVMHATLYAHDIIYNILYAREICL